MILKLAVLLLLLHISVPEAYNPDEVYSLPGLKEEINFRHYSGYLYASDGKYLHYWFVESQSVPSSDPVVLWLNGGPGCSSLDGFLSELGPFHVANDGKTLYINPYSWNIIANIIFLESPVGVGYSYSNDLKYETDDDEVSLNNYLALQHFFEKFPQFKKNDFYIAGESYAGIYIPTLSLRLLNDSNGMNFKGFAIGNGFLDQVKLSNSLIFFGYYRGLFGTFLWNQLIKYCCNDSESRSSCNFSSQVSQQCSDLVSNALKTTSISSGLNIYNIYSDCAPASVKNSRLPFDKNNLLNMFPFNKQLQALLAVPSPTCMDVVEATYWLNQKSVRTALHIPSFLPEWEVCSNTVAKGYKRVYSTMEPHILRLVNSGKLRGLIFNGDFDMVCNFLGNSWFVSDLGLKELSKYDKWEYDGNVLGYVHYYQNLTFLTVKGSGHMVPMDKPAPALRMIANFLYDKPY